MAANDICAFLPGALAAFENCNLFLEEQESVVDVAGIDRQLPGVGGGGEAGGGGNEGTAVLSYLEGSCELWHAAFVDAALNLSHPVEGEPAHQTSCDGEHYRATNGQIQLGGNPEPQGQGLL